MTGNSGKTALVTGANSGVGFEAAAQLAEAGWGHVTLACRSEEKAQAARVKLVERAGRDPFGTLTIDTSEVASADAAVDTLRERGGSFDFLLLNAGASGKDARYNSQGVEISYASSLIGHHVLTMRMLADGLLSPNVRIVIAGSEGARGNIPGMSVHNVDEIARDHFGGDLVATIEALARVKAPTQKKFSNMDEYVTAKLLVAWWAGALARRLPAGMAVNAVSPGGVLETSFARDAPLAMRLVMIPIMKVMGPLLGMNGPVDEAARRYLDAAELGDDASGHFYATARRNKLAGGVGVQTWPEYLLRRPNQEAAFDAVVSLAGVSFPEALEATP